MAWARVRSNAESLSGAESEAQEGKPTTKASADAAISPSGTTTQGIRRGCLFVVRFPLN